MLKSIRTLIAATVALAIMYCAASGSASASGTNNGKTKEESYMVIQEGEDYKVLAASGYKDEVKRLEDYFKQKMDEWHDAVKAGEKAEQPKKVIPKKLKVGFKTQKGAQKYVDDLIADKDNKGDKPAGQAR